MKSTVSSLPFTMMFILLFILNVATAEYILTAQVLSYASTTHVKYDGFCCVSPPRGSSSTCTEDCNNKFKFCLRPLNTGANSDDCPMGSYATGPISNDDAEFDLSEDLDVGVPNPLVFTGKSWPGSMEFYVRADHVNSGVGGAQGVVQEDSLVARFLIPINASPAGNGTSIAEPPYRDSRRQGPFIGLAFNLTCAENFYGENCTTMCHSGGNVTCNSDGSIRCREAFQDPGTNCTTCSLAIGCSPVGGYCNSTNGCICRDGFSGANCNLETADDPCGVSPCQNGATCSSVASEEMVFSCECAVGYTGDLCETEIINDRCGGISPCENGGSCSNVISEQDGSIVGFTCDCTQGYTGSRCESEITDLCETLSPCGNGGTCSNIISQQDPSVVNFTCDCDEGYTGRHCEIRIADLCEALSPCANGGTCVNTISQLDGSAVNFTCECAKGYTGSRCDIEITDLCGLLSPCANGGTCSNVISQQGGAAVNFTCECAQGYTGSLCEFEITDLCGVLSPCANSGTCSNVISQQDGSVMNFACVCSNGYTGTLCEIETGPCEELSPCENGGTCSNTLSQEDRNFTCECRDGFTGKRCEIDIDDCSSSPCTNGGSCQDEVGRFACTCVSGFGGRRCEVKIDYLGPFIGAAIAIAILLVIIVVMAILLLYTYCQWQTQPKRKPRITQPSATESVPASQCPSEAILASFPEDTSLEPPACHDDKNTSETFDNPIYDQPSPHRKDGSSLTESRLCGSMPSSRSISVSSNYSPLCPRAFEHSPRLEARERGYESEESLNTFWKRVNCSPQLASRGLLESDKLTVINESYGSLPCSASHSSEFLQDSSLQASGGSASLATADSRLLSGRPVISKAVSPNIWNKDRLGGGPSSREHLKHHSKHHANGFDVEIEIETSEQ